MVRSRLEGDMRQWQRSGLCERALECGYVYVGL